MNRKHTHTTPCAFMQVQTCKDFTEKWWEVMHIHPLDCWVFLFCYTTLAVPLTFCWSFLYTLEVVTTYHWFLSQARESLLRFYKWFSQRCYVICSLIIGFLKSSHWKKVYLLHFFCVNICVCSNYTYLNYIIVTLYTTSIDFISFQLSHIKKRTGGEGLSQW